MINSTNNVTINKDNSKKLDRKTNVISIIFLNRKFLLLLLFVIIYAFFAIFAHNFNTFQNIESIMIFSVEIGLLALGETLVITSGFGGIDLSVGSMVGLSAIIIGELIGKLGVNMWLAIIIGLLAGIGAGLFNGLMIVYAKIPPLLTTLATMYLYSSLALLVSMDQYGNAMPISNFPSAYSIFGQSTILGIPLQFILFFVPITIILYLLVQKTIFGKHLLATGTDEIVAKLSGINVKNIRLWVYTISGLLAAIAALIETSRIASARPDLGSNMNLEAITISVLGGTYIFGGIADIIAVFIASVLVIVLDNGLFLIGVNTIWQTGALGFLLVGALILDLIIRKRSS
jgi:ribose/xylose/arabinose/galactoside ABC-type transport system permease subunit